MEWVETSAKTLEEAKEAALDRLGVAADDAEFEVLEEPKPGLFGRTRGEGRVRARVKPTQVRPKQDRRRRSKGSGSSGRDESSSEPATTATDDADAPEADAQERGSEAVEPEYAEQGAVASDDADTGRPARRGRGGDDRDGGGRDRGRGGRPERSDDRDDDRTSSVSPDEVGAAAVAFMDGLVEAFGATGSAELTRDDLELDVRVTGQELGLLVGPGGRTLNAIQDLARVSSQRRLGDHDTRLRIDVAGYRERRTEALQRFARDVAASVRESGTARALEPMTSADRKVIHDVLNDEDGVGSRSEGDDPNRRIVVVPD